MTLARFEKIRWILAVAQASMAKPPVLMMSGNHRPILVTMTLNDWLDLVKEAKQELPEALKMLREKDMS